MSLAVLHMGEGSTSSDDSNNTPRHFCHVCVTPRGVIAALIAHDHVPTIDDLEFVGVVDGGEDLIFDALCSDSGLDPGSPTSSSSEPLCDVEDERHPTLRPLPHQKGRGR
jgi:hypothetical protein